MSYEFKIFSNSIALTADVTRCELSQPVIEEDRALAHLPPPFPKSPLILPFLTLTVQERVAI